MDFAMPGTAFAASSRTIWLFDYDLTLYGFEEHAVLDSLDANITAFVAEHLQVGPAEANNLRQRYCRDYGTTLGGLQALHNVTPQVYFDYIHSQGALQMPAADPRKHAMLSALPGHKFIFTNARRDWSDRGLQAIGIADCFTDVFDLEFGDWLGKPDPQPYHRIEAGLSRSGFQWSSPTELVLLDDKPANLDTAHRLGWSTILVHPQAYDIDGPYDLRIRHLLDLPRHIV